MQALPISLTSTHGALLFQVDIGAAQEVVGARVVAVHHDRLRRRPQFHPHRRGQMHRPRSVPVMPPPWLRSYQSHQSTNQGDKVAHVSLLSSG